MTARQRSVCNLVPYGVGVLVRHAVNQSVIVICTVVAQSQPRPAPTRVNVHHRDNRSSDDDPLSILYSVSLDEVFDTSNMSSSAPVVPTLSIPILRIVYLL